MDAVLINIDHALADDRHRQHHVSLRRGSYVRVCSEKDERIEYGTVLEEVEVPGEETRYKLVLHDTRGSHAVAAQSRIELVVDEESYWDDAYLDTPRLNVATLAWQLKPASNIKKIFYTSRSEGSLPAVKEWLQRFNFTSQDNDLILADMDGDEAVKRAKQDGYRPFMHIDGSVNEKVAAQFLGDDFEEHY